MNHTPWDATGAPATVDSKDAMGWSESDYVYLNRPPLPPNYPNHTHPGPSHPGMSHGWCYVPIAWELRYQGEPSAADEQSSQCPGGNLQPD